MYHSLILLLALGVNLQAGTGGGLMKAIAEAGLDAAECYRVRDLSLARDEAQLFFTDGYLIFGKPAGSTRVLAMFSAEVEGGDGELLLLPPNRAERMALGKHAGTPNLDEHFSNGVFVFSDRTYSELMEQIAANPYIKKVPEMGALLAEKWGPVARNVSGSFRMRLALDLLSAASARKGFFAAALSGRHLGAFDVIYEPRSREQLLAGQSAGAGFDLWTSFTSRSFRNTAFQPEFGIADYRIDSTVGPDLSLRCVTHMKITPFAGSERALPLEISNRMRVTSASINGEPAEVLTIEAQRLSLPASGENALFVVAPPHPLEAGKTYDLEIHHEGNVISDAGNRVYFVGSRGNWYPGRGMNFARFDLTFHYPRDLNLVSTGDPDPGQPAERLEGDQRLSHRLTPAPVRLAGFNLGVYEMARGKRGGLEIEVCANKNSERALQPKAVSVISPEQGGEGLRRTRSRVDSLPESLAAPPASPVDRLQALAADIGAVMDFYTARFGPPPTKTLEVTPVPGRFGQGFPGLIYLSTLAYQQTQDAFFTDLLSAHEAAHQWWGNIVTSAGYHDDWLMEALANYSALLYLEKKKGPRAANAFLDDYRIRLLAKLPGGGTVESGGPVVQGMRVDGNWSAVVYGKGTWILHMLRRRMGDEAFLKMLGQLRRTYEDKSISTDEFRVFCAGFLPPKTGDPHLESFFDQWVYGTGIPTLKLAYKSTGAKVTGTVAQAGVDEDFSADVPVEIQQGKLKPVVVFVHAASEPVAFSATLKAPATRVQIDLHGVLAR